MSNAPKKPSSNITVGKRPPACRCPETGYPPQHTNFGNGEYQVAQILYQLAAYFNESAMKWAEESTKAYAKEMKERKKPASTDDETERLVWTHVCWETDGVKQNVKTIIVEVNDNRMNPPEFYYESGDSHKSPPPSRQHKAWGSVRLPTPHVDKENKSAQ